MDDPWPGSSFISNYCLVFTKALPPAGGKSHASTPDDNIHGAP
jgi:hypothetical protein